jgi:hypothetical protein
MLDLLRLLQVISAGHKLKLSMSKLETILIQLIALLTLAMFLATFAALGLAGIFYAGFHAMLRAGVGNVTAAIIIVICALTLFALGINLLKSYLDTIRRALHGLDDSHPPLLGKVGHIAGSFVGGLLDSGTQPQVKLRR